MKILIIDDDRISRIKLERFLKSFGVCDMVDNGMAGLDLFKKAWDDWYPYDLITLDIEMPDVSGEEILMELRDLESNKKVPADKKVKIVMVTSHSDPDSVSNCISAGCNNFIIKPFNKESIKKIIKELF